MKINLVKAGTTYLGDLCAGNVFQTVDGFKDKYFMKTDGTYDDTPTVIDLETGALYDMPDTIKVIFKKAVVNVEE